MITPHGWLKTRTPSSSHSQQPAVLLTPPHASSQLAVNALQNEPKEYTDQRKIQETEDEVDVVAVATGEAASVDSEERKKERRRRRCPIVNVGKYLNNEEDEGETKEDGTPGKNRYIATLQGSIWPP